MCVRFFFTFRNSAQRAAVRVGLACPIFPLPAKGAHYHPNGFCTDAT